MHSRSLNTLGKTAIAGALSFWLCSVHAGFGGMGNVESDGSGAFTGAAFFALAIGAAIGYVAERAWNRHQLDKQGIKYTSDYLGGKLGAIIGAIALPILIGLFA